jgi:hypothetical protein
MIRYIGRDHFREILTRITNYYITAVALNTYSAFDRKVVSIGLGQEHVREILTILATCDFTASTSRSTERFICVFLAQEEERGHDRPVSQHVINNYIYDVTSSLIFLSNVSSTQDDSFVKHFSSFEEYGKIHFM